MVYEMCYLFIFKVDLYFLKIFFLIIGKFYIFIIFDYF